MTWSLENNTTRTKESSEKKPANKQKDKQSVAVFDSTGVRDIDIRPGYRTDHSMVVLKLEQNQTSEKVSLK